MDASIKLLVEKKSCFLCVKLVMDPPNAALWWGSDSLSLGISIQGVLNPATISPRGRTINLTELKEYTNTQKNDNTLHGHDSGTWCSLFPHFARPTLTLLS